jgi:hypothetical protein
VKGSGEASKLSFKKIVIEDFTLFCDWKDTDQVENGHVDIEKLEEEHQKLVEGTLSEADDSYFK